LLGLILRLPTGWFTSIVAPSWNGSTFRMAVNDLSSLGRRDDRVRFWYECDGVCEADDRRDADSE
jgi:hypothetical protein